jgi:hypothetical protein
VRCRDCGKSYPEDFFQLPDDLCRKCREPKPVIIDKGVLEDQASGKPLGERIPEGAITFKNMGDWVLYYSKEEQAFYIKSTDYHPRPLRLTKVDLLEMLTDVERLPEGDTDDS